MSDHDLIAELLARIRDHWLTGRIAPVVTDADGTSLLPRLIDEGFDAVPGEAMALLIAIGRRGRIDDPSSRAATDLPADIHHRLVWWTAAAIRADTPSADNGVSDRLLVSAALALLAAHDEGDRVEAAAQRLARALIAGGGNIAALLGEALGDRRTELFTALVAEGLGLDFVQVRDLVQDHDPSVLILALRALAIDRDGLARIAAALYPDRLSLLVTVIGSASMLSADRARAAIDPLRLPAAYRTAVRSLVLPGANLR